mgnify:CR=1 FL=1
MEWRYQPPKEDAALFIDPIEEWDRWLHEKASEPLQCPNGRCHKDCSQIEAAEAGLHVWTPRGSYKFLGPIGMARKVEESIYRCPHCSAFLKYVPPHKIAVHRWWLIATVEQFEEWRAKAAIDKAKGGE